MINHKVSTQGGTISRTSGETEGNPRAVTCLKAFTRVKRMELTVKKNKKRKRILYVS
jgi:hypothetical protein